MPGLEFVPVNGGKDGLDVKTFTIMPDRVPGAYQGHQDQFIAEMAQWGISINHKFIVKGKEYTYEDFLRHAKACASLKTGQELSWAILCLGQYYGTDISWTNSAGEKLQYEDLVRYELEQPVVGAACGGTHRLFGLTWAYRLHMRSPPSPLPLSPAAGERGWGEGEKTSVWQDIEKKSAEYKQRAREMQNSDGSLSTDYFEKRADERDMSRRMNTTGHMFEWLALALSDDELKEPWVENAANALTMMFFDIQDKPMETGTLYHAMHGLLIYYARVYDPAKLGPHRPYFPGEPLKR